MTVIEVPYHIDEYLPDLDVPVVPTEVVSVDLPTGGVWSRLATLYRAVSNAVTDAVRRGDRAIVVAGDCTTALGTVAGLQHAGIDPGIIWCDAHGDIQTLETTASGYLGGLPLRLLAGYRPELIALEVGLRPVPESRIILAGRRDLDPPEVAYLAEAEIRRVELKNLGSIELPGGPPYVHLDLDVIDPSEIPGLRYPAPGGRSAATVASVLSQLIATGRVAAVDLACSWFPGHGAVQRTSESSSELRSPSDVEWTIGRPAGVDDPPRSSSKHGPAFDARPNLEDFAAKSRGDARPRDRGDVGAPSLRRDGVTFAEVDSPRREHFEQPVTLGRRS